jgi:hypothetical protein
MGEGRQPSRFSVYRWDIHAGESGYVAEERYHTIDEVLAHPYQPNENYCVRLHGSSGWMRKDEFERWALEQSTKSKST